MGKKPDSCLDPAGSPTASENHFLTRAPRSPPPPSDARDAAPSTTSPAGFQVQSSFGLPCNFPSGFEVARNLRRAKGSLRVSSRVGLLIFSPKHCEGETIRLTI